MKKQLMCARHQLALLSLIALVSFGVLAFFYGDKLSSVQLTLITMVATQIASKAASAFAYYFDGTPTKPEKEPA